MQRGSSYGIPLLLLHVTIEGRPHSFARELRGDGLKITPKDGMKEIVEQQRRTRFFFSKLLFFLPQKITLSLFSCRSRKGLHEFMESFFLLMTNIMCLIISTMSGFFPSIFSNLG